MGYNITAAAVERQQEHLDMIYAAVEKGNKIRFDPPNPNTFGFQIREAVRSAIELEIPPYDQLRLKVSVKRDHVLVQGRLAGSGEGTLSGREISTRPDPQSFSEAVTEFDVIQIAVKFPSETRLLFPNFAGRIRFVQQWAEKKGYEVSMGPPLTLTKIEEEPRHV